MIDHALWPPEQMLPADRERLARVRGSTHLLSGRTVDRTKASR